METSPSSGQEGKAFAMALQPCVQHWPEEENILQLRRHPDRVPPCTEVVATFLGKSLAATILGRHTGLPAAPSDGGQGKGCGGGWWQRWLELSPEPLVQMGDAGATNLSPFIPYKKSMVP